MFLNKNCLQRIHFSGFHHPKCFEVGRIWIDEVRSEITDFV